MQNSVSVPQQFTDELTAEEAESDNWRRWRKYFLFGMAIVLVLLLAKSGLTVRLLALTCMLLLALGTRRTAYMVGAIIVVELSIAQEPPRFFGVPLGVSTRYAITFGVVAMIILLIPIKGIKFDLGPGAKRLLIPSIALVGIIYYSTVNGFTPELTLQALRFFTASLAIMVLIPMLVRDKTDMHIVAVITIAMMVISGLAAILQAVGPSALPSIAIVSNAFADGRAAGLSVSPILVSTHLMLGTLLLWGLVTQRTLRRPSGQFLLLLAVVVVGGLFFTYTRSALFGAALAAVFFMTPLLKGRARKEIFIAILVLAPVAVFLMLGSSNRFTERSATEDLTTGSRGVLWKTGIAIAMDFPNWGIGYNAYNQVAPAYLQQVRFTDGIDARTMEVVEKSPVHNDFIRIWLSFGTPALVFYLVILVAIGANFLQAYFKEKDLWLRGASIGGFGGLIAYILDSSVHNSFDSTAMLWVLAGFSILLLRFATRQGSAEHQEVQEAQA